MKCEEINFLEYIEGHASEKIIAHIAGCPRCHPESDKLLQFSKGIRKYYVTGKRAERELEERLQSIHPTKIKKMPAKIDKKIIELKERALTSKLVNLFGTDEKTRKRLFESLLSPQSIAIAASPKDITQSKKQKKRRKK